MKKLLTSVLAFTAVIGFAGCAKNKTTSSNKTTNNTTGNITTNKVTTTAKVTTEAKKETVKIMTPAGTPLMGVAGLSSDESVVIKKVSGPEALGPALAKKEADIIVAPMILGAKSFVSNSSTYKLEAVLTTDNTYLVSRTTTTFDSLDDLDGKKIIAYGLGNTPDYALQNALSTTTAKPEITYETSVTDAVTQFVGVNGVSTYDFCLIAEPQLTSLKVKEGLSLNVKSLSDYSDSTIYQAGIFVNPNANQERVDEVIKQISDNVTYLNTNPEEYATNYTSVIGMAAPILKQAIPNANISFIKGSDNKEAIKAYFASIISFNDKLIPSNVTDEFFR